MHRPVSIREADISLWWKQSSHSRSLELAWLGQAGFLIKLGGVRIVIDPYLSDSLARKYKGGMFPHRRMMPPPIAPRAIDGADLVVSTHEHTDHLDPGTLPTLCDANPGALVVVPRYAAAIAMERGVPANRLVPLDLGETWTSPLGLTVEPAPAAHEEVVRDPVGNRKYLGYVIRNEGGAVFHSGDTVPCGELETILESRARIDVALLPANGRDTIRRENGVPGNFTGEEAMRYHQRFGFGTTVLHHFGMFDFNTVDPDELARQASARGISDSIVIPKVNTVYRWS